jgi:nitrite reductase (NADH) small subunit
MNMSKQVSNWQAVCASSELASGLGIRALLDGNQVAIFKLKEKLYALDAIDPFSNAAVIARGLVGDLKGQLVVASPLYKQHFNLETGVCLEDESVSLKVYPVREQAGQVELGQI